jgi:hypothetical protein
LTENKYKILWMNYETKTCIRRAASCAGGGHFLRDRRDTTAKAGVLGQGGQNGKVTKPAANLCGNYRLLKVWFYT